MPEPNTSSAGALMGEGGGLIFSTIALGTLWLIADAQDARRAQALDNITDDYSDADARTAALAQNITEGE